MEELDISGKRYISTRLAARENGYHSDYMGQLVRSGKVTGQKVGRAWYIEEHSLAMYLGRESVHQVAPEPEVASAEEAITEAAAPMVEEAAKEEVRHIEKEIKEEKQVAADIVIREDIAAPQKVEEAPQIMEEPAEKVKVIKQEPEAEPVDIKNIPEAEDEFVEEKSTRIPIHIPAAAIQDIGGLRYEPDDSSSLPIITRMPQPPYVHHESTALVRGHHHPLHPAPKRSSLPWVGLSVVGVLALLAAGFASNFISTTIEIKPGQTATVERAIHW